MPRNVVLPAGTEAERSSRASLTARAALTALREHADPIRAAGAGRYFKTAPGEYGAGDRFLGVTVPAVRRLARTYSGMPMREVERLLRSPWHEARLLALLLMVRQYGRAAAKGRRAIYRCYVRNMARINNWDLVDSSAAYIVGPQLSAGSRAPLRRFARSKDVWTRRIAVLGTFHYIKEGEFGESLSMAQQLLDDPHDLIHKAVGWMLREVGKRDRAALQMFLDRNAARMPRTMLRYSLEHFPVTLRKRYMAK